MSKRTLPDPEDEGQMRCRKQTVLDEDAKALLLTELLKNGVFGPRASKLRIYSVKYIVEMRHDPAPHALDFIEYIRARDASAPLKVISFLWNSLKGYFSQENRDVYEVIKDLMNLPATIAAFEAIAPLDIQKPITMTDDTTPAPPSSIPTISSSSSPTKRSRDSSNGSSSNTTTLGPVALAKMRSEFQHNYSAFKGDPWKLPSGTVVDDRIAENIKDLRHESALHSFIIEDVAEVANLFSSDDDKAALRDVIEERRSEQLATLSPAEVAFLYLYDVSLEEMKNLLKSGWGNMGSTLNDLPDEHFRALVHDCIGHLHRVYQMNSMSLPHRQSEAWYLAKLWGFLNIVFDSDDRLEHQPGKVPCYASEQRKNRSRRPDVKQITERKVNGLVLSAYTRLELCIIEATKDGGVTCTGTLSDTRWMAKTMKDMHDEIRAKATEGIRSQLITYGIRISGATIALYTLRQRQGRFYQLCNEGTATFPAKWDSSGATTKWILSVLEWILAFKKDMSIMANKFPDWTYMSMGSIKPGVQDHRAATLTTPTNSPRLSPAILTPGQTSWT